MGVFILTACGQDTFDKKLKSLYRNTVPLIHAETLSKSMAAGKTVILLDTRSMKEYEVSHLENAKFVDYGSFKATDVGGMDKNAEIIVYCSVGYRSERIGEKLQQLGFRNVKNLYGGIFDWVNKGNMIVNKDGVRTDSVHTYNRDWSQWLTKGVKVY